MYEINISLNGQHFFATHERSIVSERKLKEVYGVLKEKFPKAEGYELSVIYWTKSGREINMDELNKA